MKLVPLAAAWIAGLVAGLETGVYLPALVMFSVAAGVTFILFRTRGITFWPSLLALVVLMGFIRVEASEKTVGLEPSDNLQSVTVRGLIVSDPEVSGPGVGLTISLDAVDRGTGWEEAKGRVQVFARPPRDLVMARSEPYFRYGDRLAGCGKTLVHGVSEALLG